MTGRELRGTFPSYEGALGAARAIKEGGGLQHLATQLLGVPVGPKMAAVGDVVLVLNAEREMLAICNGTSALAPGKCGMVLVSMEAALSAWRI